jgi:PAS domain S-box-containing protein
VILQQEYRQRAARAPRAGPERLSERLIDSVLRREIPMKTNPQSPLLLRAQAEARLARQEAAQRAPVDPVRVVHELQVHQIELELQNEERGRSYAEVAALRDKYRELYDFAPVGYCTLAPEGVIKELNLAAATLLGEESAMLVGRRLQDFLEPECLAMFAEFIGAASLGNSVAPALLALRPHGALPVYVRFQGRPFAAAQPDSKGIHVAMMDLTELRTANAELRKSFENFFSHWRP